MNKKKFLNKVSAAVLALCCIGATLSLPTMTADAGLVPFEIGETQLQNGAETNYWYATNDVAASSSAGKVVFGANSNATSRIASKNRVANMKSAGKVECLNAEMTLMITSVASGSKFGVTVGLPYVFDYAETAESSWIWFEESGAGLKMGVSVYDVAGAENVIFESQGVVATKGDQFTLAFVADVNGGLVLSINGETLINNANANFDAEGYTGFAQTGASQVEISNIEMIGYTNDTPINADIRETFTDNEFNALALYSLSDWTKEENKGIYVEDEAIAFKNAATAHLSTKREYSNVDVSFDLVVGRVTKVDANGVTLRSVSRGFAMVFGAEDYKVGAGDIMVEFSHTNSDFLHPKVDTILRVRQGTEKLVEVQLDESLNIFSERLPADTVVNVWVTMLDGELTVWLKYAGDMIFTKALVYDLGTTPNGFVQIVSDGYDSGNPESTLCNMKLDNLCFTNFDKDRMTETLAFRSSIWDTSDFEYEDEWDYSDLLG